MTASEASTGLRKRISCRDRRFNPLNEYTVQPNDTYAVIAGKAYVPQMQLMQANPDIPPNRLRTGMKVKIPDISNYLAGTLQFYVIRTPEADRELINDFAPYSSAISLFEYHFGPNGDIMNDLNDRTAIETTWQNRVRPLAVITNLTEGIQSGISPSSAAKSGGKNESRQQYRLLNRKKGVRRCKYRF